MEKEATQASALKQYFGLKEGQTLASFAKELKALSSEEKRELAEEAAKEMGLKLKD